MMAPRTVLKNVHELILFSIVLAIVLEAVEGGKRSVTWSNHVNMDGVVTSPNYPNVYPNNYKEMWKFTVPPDYKLELVFDYFELEAHDACGYDYVAVFDGPLESHPLLGKFCGSAIPSPVIKTTAGQMLMIFQTDGGTVKKGFKVTHTTKFNLEAIVSTEIEKDLFTQYFRMTTPQQAYITNKWGMDVARIAVSFFLADPTFFDPDYEIREEIVYELTLQLMSKLVMKKRISTKDLATFVNAMTVTCINPKKFFGLNVVAELRKRVDSNNDTNPFFLLALCIGGGNMSTHDVEKLKQLFYANLRPSSTGTQAVVVMALQCISRKSQINLNAVLAEMVLKLKEKQQNNGMVENPKTTALVIQALVATDNYKSNFNMSMAIKSILKDKMYRYLSSETIYYILPIIQWKTFLDINSNHCEKFIKTELEETEKLTTEQHEGDIHVQISIIIGDDMDFSRTWRIKVPANYSFYQVMENISVTYPDYKVQYTILEGKPFVFGLNKYEDSIENGLFLFTYKKSFSSNGNLVLVEKSPIDIQVRETNELILWYRSRPWASAQEISTDAPSTVTTYKPLASTTDVTSTDTSDESLASTTDVTSTDTSDESLAHTTEADTDKFFWDF